MKRPEFSALLPDSQTLERFIVSASFAIGRTPKLLECSQASLLSAVLTAAELKLDFTPSLGLAYMVPYGSDCQFQIGYRGLGTLAVRSGSIVGFEAHVVHAKDTFLHELGTSGFIKHERPPLGTDRGEMVGAYAIVQLPNGSKQFDVMDKMEIGAIKARSRAKSGPWVSDTAEMWKKTVMKRLCKYLNLTPEIGKALEADNADFDPTAPTTEPTTPAAPKPHKIDAIVEQAPEVKPGEPPPGIKLGEGAPLV